MWINNLGLQFKEIVSLYPNNIALFIDNLKFSYKELDIYSDKIANFLLDNGLRPKDVINISSIKVFDTFAIIVACWKTGIIYSVIDRDSPLNRISEILKICKPKFILGDENFIDLFSSYKGIKKYSYKELESISNKKSNQKVKLNFPGDLIAYIMFTSGSTGIPNGVAISHSSLLQFLEWTKDEYNITENDNISGLNSLFFDNSVFDLYASFLNGASYISLSRKVVKDPKITIELLNRFKITIWFSVPSLLIYYLSFGSFNQNTFLNLRYIIFGGEGFPKNKLRQLFLIFGEKVKLSNVYGPTEGTCICSNYFINENDFDEVEMKKLAPLGKILRNFIFYILDENLKQVDIGEVGQLALGGAHISKGYYRNSEKTKQRFIQNPNNLNCNEVIYLTGDLVKINNKNKLIYFQGRMDSQIKFMGYRIELGEIESLISSIDGINESVVLYGIKDTFNQITCFLSSELDSSIIRENLKSKLPSYMIPRKFVYLDFLPKNANGKIDKKKIRTEYYD